MFSMRKRALMANQNIVTRWQSEEYDPSMRALVAKADDDWGDPELNRNNLVKWGIAPLDRALWGVDIISGEMNLILGAQKERKTTVILNILKNIMKQTPEKVHLFGSVDSLESGMPPERFRDTLISMVASDILIEDGHIPVNHGRCPICNGECYQLRLSPDSLRYMKRTKDQQDAIQKAKEITAEWRLNLYGASNRQGTTRNLELSDERWRYLHDLGYNLFFIDHVQQYRLRDNDNASDYEKQIEAISKIGSFVAETKSVVFLLSQVSLWSQRDNALGLTASGGKKGHQEANSVISTKYTDNSGFVTITLEESRKSGGFYMYQKIDDESGTFYGKTYLPQEWEKEKSKMSMDLVQAEAF